MSHFIPTHKVVWVVAVYSLLLLGLLLVVIASRLGMLSFDAYQMLLIAMALAFPLVTLALMRSVSSDN